MKREGYLRIFDAKYDLMYRICPIQDKAEWQKCHEKYMPMLDEIERAVREDERNKIKKLINDLRDLLT